MAPFRNRPDLSFRGNLERVVLVSLSAMGITCVFPSSTPDLQSQLNPYHFTPPTAASKLEVMRYARLFTASPLLLLRMALRSCGTLDNAQIACADDWRCSIQVRLNMTSSPSSFPSVSANWTPKGPRSIMILEVLSSQVGLSSIVGHIANRFRLWRMK